MSWSNIAEEKFITSLMNETLTINSGGRSPATRRAESRARSAQRRLNIAPMAMNFDESSNSPAKPIISPEEMSFYVGNSPQGSPRCSVSPCMDIGMLSPGFRETETLDDFNSQDSGYGTSRPKSQKKNNRKLFDFVQPSGVAPRRADSLSPPKVQLNTTPVSTSVFRSFNSLSSDSMESMDDDCMELLEMDDLDDNTQLPTSFNNIISGSIKSNNESRVPLLRRCLSLTDGNVQRDKLVCRELSTPDMLKSVAEGVSPFHSKAPECVKTFKRPDPPSCSPVYSKRCKPNVDDKENVDEVPATRPVFRKSISMNDAIIMNALARSSSEPDLIGDFSKPFCLPLMEGRHSDLKSISAQTMSKLLNGEYKDSVASFKVIDCRYPYEFEGGHIRNAINLYTHEQIMTELVNIKTEAPKVVPEGPMRNIIVFHCEFSSERGPKLSRFLRNHDRSRNESSYPALHYPEIYLLHGGYKEFYEQYSELCDPVSYRPMLDPNFNEAYRHFRAKSKSWTGDSKSSARSIRFVKTKSRNLIY